METAKDLQQAPRNRPETPSRKPPENRTGPRPGVQRQLGGTGFRQGSRALSPRQPGEQAPETRAQARAAGRAPAPAAIPAYVEDRAYGWTARFDVAFEDKACLVTIRLHLEPQDGVTPEDVAAVQQQTGKAFQSFFDNRFQLRDRASGTSWPLKVRLVFTDRDPHLQVRLRKGAGRDDVLNWFVKSEPIVRAHELGHQLGLKDEYIDSTAESRKDASAPGVHRDHSLMGNFWEEGVEKAEVKQRHAQDIADRIGRGTGRSLEATPLP